MKENLETILESSFLDYSAFVLQRRAIPDARDGLKYTARQILHAQYKDKLDANHPFKKSQKSVSAATSFSYVHGDTSAYEQIIRMGRPLVQRCALEEINGNSGTPTGSDTYSAARYTEARLSPLGTSLFEYINDNVLGPNEWSPTYDEEGVFPLVLPSIGFYNICNGSFGSIGVGLISSIPQFNLAEMNKTIVDLIDDPTAEVNLLPDFASGGILLNPKTTAQSLAKGEGKSALIRGKVRKNAKEGWLEVTELPYGVYTNTVCVELEKALEKGGAPFTKFKDLTQKGVQLRIYSKNVDELEAWLYKNTSVQKHFTIKLIMLNNGKTPKLFSLKEAILAHIAHAKKVLRNHYGFELQGLKDEEEVLRGLIRAHSIMDQIIATIRESQGRADAINKLRVDYTFTLAQATAIVDLRLHKLSSIDIADLHNKLDINISAQTQIQEILNNEKKFNATLAFFYNKTAGTFGDPRRTQIADTDVWETEGDGGKPERNFMVYFGKEGYVASYSVTDEVFTPEMPVGKVELDKEYVIVTSKMRGFVRKGSDFILGSVAWKDALKIDKDEYIVFVMDKYQLESFQFICFETQSGDKYVIHSSFITCGASQRGKKLVNGKYNVVGYSMETDSTKYPRMR